MTKTEIDSKFDEVNSKINYIYFGLGGLLLLILPLFFRRKDKKLEQVADISVVDSRVQISTPKKKYSSKEKMSFSFSHKFDKESYLYILDINLRNETTLLYPTQKDVNLIQPNQTVNIPNIDVVQPFGDDILKIIASPIPLEIPEIVYSKESKIFADSRGFKNPEIEKIESEIAENKEVSPLDLLGHFRGQASKNRITIFENHIKIKTFE